MNTTQSDKIADDASKRQIEFRRKHWAYFNSRDRAHPITGEIPQRNYVLDAKFNELVEANRKAQKQAEDIAYLEKIGKSRKD